MKRTATLVLAVVAASLFSLASPGEAQAQPVTLTLDLVSRVNVEDAAGRWQHEAGVVYCAEGHVAFGPYTIQRRVTIGAEIGEGGANWAAVTVTLLFASITLQGAHDFDTGSYLGSVSAADRFAAPVRGRSFTGSTLPAGFFGSGGTLTIDRFRRLIGSICDSPTS